MKLSWCGNYAFLNDTFFITGAIGVVFFFWVNIF